MTSLSSVEGEISNGGGTPHKTAGMAIAAVESVFYAVPQDLHFSPMSMTASQLATVGVISPAGAVTNVRNNEACGGWDARPTTQIEHGSAGRQDPCICLPLRCADRLGLQRVGVRYPSIAVGDDALGVFGGHCDTGALQLVRDVYQKGDASAPSRRHPGSEFPGGFTGQRLSRHTGGENECPHYWRVKRRREAEGADG